jgi:hypothetical protein
MDAPAMRHIEGALTSPLSDIDRLGRRLDLLFLIPKEAVDADAEKEHYQYK